MRKKKKYILLMFQNMNREEQVILLMIPNGEWWHYLAVKSISIIQKNKIKILMMIFIVWIVFIPLENRNKLEFHKKVWENKDFPNVAMPSEDTIMLDF